MQIYNDELYHYGKLGMKWGRRKSPQEKAQKKADKKAYKKEYAQAIKDQFRHPIHSTAAQLKLLKNKPLKALNMDLKTVKELNVDVKNRVTNEAQKKRKIKEYRKQINAGESTVGRIYNKLTDADKYQAEIMYNQKHKR